LGEGDVLGFWLGDPLVKHLGVRTPDALREIEVAPVLNGSTSAEGQEEQEKEG
jgi:hypothetical protein